MKLHPTPIQSNSKEEKKTNLLRLYFENIFLIVSFLTILFRMNLDTLLSSFKSFFQTQKMQEEIVFLTESETLTYLSQLILTAWEEKILNASFRTRTRKIANTLDFQFRTAPESLTESEKHDLEITKNTLKSQFTSLLPDKSIEVTIKISDCCGKKCYGCKKYTPEETPQSKLL